MVDFVDLTTPSGTVVGNDGRPEPQQGGVKRRRSEPEAIDLEAEEEEEASAARQRIMQFARRVNAERAAQVAGLEGAPQAQQQQEQQQQATGGTSGEQQQQEAGAAPPANTLLAQLHAERMARQAQRQPPLQQQQYQQQQPAGGRTEQRAPPALPHQYPTAAEQQQQRQGGASGSIKLLTWNVWFAEEVHVQARMAAIGRVIEERQPDFVTLQEVTPLIYQLFSSAPWWRAYAASPCPPGVPYFTALLWRRGTVQGVSPDKFAVLPFENSRMGRDLKTVAGSVGGTVIRVATTHLESPTGWNQLWSEQRVAQLKQSAAVLDTAREGDVLFAGDMNWGPYDGPPPLPGGWTDSWQYLHSGDPGLTYDPRSNPMLKPSNRIRRRLDRVFVKLQHWRLHSMEMVGQQALPGLQHDGRPVLPSDHFGLLLELRPALG